MSQTASGTAKAACPKGTGARVQEVFTARGKAGLGNIAAKGGEVWNEATESVGHRRGKRFARSGLPVRANGLPAIVRS